MVMAMVMSKQLACVAIIEKGIYQEKHFCSMERFVFYSRKHDRFGPDVCKHKNDWTRYAMQAWLTLYQTAQTASMSG